jgi:cell division transport system permease protein
MFVQNFSYFIEEGFRSLRHNRFMSVVAIVTIGFALMIFGAFLIVYSNVQQITDGWIQEVEVTAYLRQGISDDAADEIKKRLWENREIASVAYVSQEQALQRFKSEHADAAYLLEGLTNNPLPASFEIGLSKEARSREAVERLAAKLGKVPELEGVQYGEEWTKSLLTFLKILRLLGFILGGLLGVAIIFIIANTVRLTVYARRDELAVMRLIGATNWFIKGPFLTEGLLQGLVGALLSLGLLFGMYHFWLPRLQASAGIFFLQSVPLSFLSVDMLLWIVAAGMLMGFFGSLMSVGRFLKI